MWPWEHLAVGYLAYSLGKRAFGSPAPDRAEVIALAFATQLPDLVDKPLGWGTDLLPSGISLAHSYLVALPVVVLAYLVARGLDEPQVGLAFGTGYLLHTPADILATYLLDGELIVGALLWPLVATPAIGTQPLLGRAIELWVSYLETIQTPAGQAYLLVEVALVGGALLLWIADRRSKATGASSEVHVE